MMKESRFLSRIDWELIQIIVLIGFIPGMILLGGIFYDLFTPNYAK